LTDRAAAAPVVCQVSLRARVVVGEPFFEPGRPLTLGKVGRLEARPGDLVAVDPIAPGRGRVVEVLGAADDVSVVLHGLAVEAGAAALWPAAVAAEADRLPAGTGGAAGRTDLRDLLTFTIDPAEAKDHDDALSVDGDRVLVHIADVTAFVAEGGPIDAEAARRATSIYLPGRVDPMLPDRLSSDLCSLVPGHDRLAVTVDVSAAGRLRAFPSLIRSDHRLSYDEADALLRTGRGRPELVEALRRLDGVARARAEARAARGGVTVETPERVFRIAGGTVMEAGLDTSGGTHVLVEELMLAANEAVAAALAAAGAAMPYRVHEPPDPAGIESLVERLAALGVPTPPLPALHGGDDAARYAGLLSQTVAGYVRSSGRGREAFPAMVLRALRKARYDAANLGHSGLASRAYCHFTSPIRRYPDVMVHRALRRHLRDPGAAAATGSERVAALAGHASEAERAAERLERRGGDVCAAFLLEHVLYEQGWETAFPGEVVGVIDSGAFVRFGDVFEGYLPGRAWAGEYVQLDPLGIALVAARSGRRLRLGDRVDVAVRSVDRAAGRARLRMPQAT
jgi:ribonuclease R